MKTKDCSLDGYAVNAPITLHCNKKEVVCTYILVWKIVIHCHNIYQAESQTKKQVNNNDISSASRFQRASRKFPFRRAWAFFRSYFITFQWNCLPPMKLSSSIDRRRVAATDASQKMIFINAISFFCVDRVVRDGVPWPWRVHAARHTTNWTVSDIKTHYFRLRGFFLLSPVHNGAHDKFPSHIFFCINGVKCHSSFQNTKFLAVFLRPPSAGNVKQFCRGFFSPFTFDSTANESPNEIWYIDTHTKSAQVDWTLCLVCVGDEAKRPRLWCIFLYWGAVDSRNNKRGRSRRKEIRKINSSLMIGRATLAARLFVVLFFPDTTRDLLVHANWKSWAMSAVEGEENE